MGGKREGAGRHKRDCECERCKAKLGSRPTNTAVASRVLAQAKAEKLWLSLISLECRRLGIGKSGDLLAKVTDDGTISGPDYQGKFSIIPLTNLLRYLEDRAFGRPMDTVNHLHKEPIQLEATVKISEIVREVRERKEKYERGKHS